MTLTLLASAFGVLGATAQEAVPIAVAEDVATEGSLVVGLLWFVAIAFMFFAQHHVCDAYFVPAINVFVTQMRKSKSTFLQRWGEEAVAGATICALGCNGPELFTNLISLYTGSDAGIGVVVGSEIFNLLIIVGAATICAPILPLQLERVPFARDCFFYGLSIFLLYQFLLDKQIECWEAFSLLGAAAVYVITVYFTTDIVNCIWGKPKEGLLDGEDNRKQGKMHGVKVTVEEILHGRMADGHNAGASGVWDIDADQTKNVWHLEQLDAVKSMPVNTAAMRGSVGFQMAGAGDDPMLNYENLSEVVVGEMGVIELQFIKGFAHKTLRVTAIEDDPEDVPAASNQAASSKPPSKHDELLNNIEKFSKLRGKELYVHNYDASIKGAIDHFVHALSSKDTKLAEKLFAVPELLIDILLKGTLFWVDVKDKKRQGRWLLCFAGAMFWLAVFSYLMLEVAEQIHYNIPALPNSFLGITVCAIGTSFPNAVASVLMAQENKPAAAIANALGSNVQNVFLAMALPWVIYSCQNGMEPIQQNVEGITEGVYWMLGTLILVIIFVLAPPVCSINKVYGYILMVVYVGYLVLTSGEVFKWWPVLVKS
jgi:Ca2+/Na+ antiporter